VARPLRVLVPGGWGHVFNRGGRRERIFRTDDDRRRFLGWLDELPRRFRVGIRTFVLMDNPRFEWGHLRLRDLWRGAGRSFSSWTAAGRRVGGSLLLASSAFNRRSATGLSFSPRSGR
jgi:hypothetical protein